MMLSTKQKSLRPLIDGDIVVFRAGMAGQYMLRSVFYKDLPDHPLVTLRYMADLKDWLKENELEADDVDIVVKEVIEPLPQILHIAKQMMKSITQKYKGKPSIYLSGSNNFREELAKEIPYKGNRWSEEKRDAARENNEWIQWLNDTEAKHSVPRRPHWEAQIKLYLIQQHGAIVIDGQEADDAIGIEHAQSKDTVIVSVDKDLKTIPGYYQNLADIEEDPIRVTQADAIRFFYKQILMGDSADNIPGLHRVGDKVAESIIGDATTAKALMEAVWLKYCSFYGDLTYDEIYEKILNRGQLLYIRQKENDIWTPPVKQSTLYSMIPQG